MKKRSVRLLCAAAAVLLIAAGSLAAIGEESLVSLRYLAQSFLPEATKQLQQSGEEQLQQSYAQALEELDIVQEQALGELTGGEQLRTSAVLQPREWSDGEILQMTTGSGVLMQEGAVVVAHQGVVIDVTEGAEVSSGSRLIHNHRYLVGEDTQASFMVVSGAATMGVQGEYRYNRGLGDPTPFYDVAHGDWYYDAVGYVYDNSLFSGMSTHIFGPQETMTRAMLMTVLFRLAGSPVNEMEQADVHFDDVAENAWYRSFVHWGASQKITAGTGPNTFGPDEMVTREQVILLLLSFSSRYPGVDFSARADLSGFADADQVSGWARDAMSWAVAWGMVDPSGLLEGPRPATRAEVASMLHIYSQMVS